MSKPYRRESLPMPSAQFTLDGIRRQAQELADRYEARRLLMVLEGCDWRLYKAAEQLRCPLSTLHSRMRRLPALSAEYDRRKPPRGRPDGSSTYTLRARKAATKRARKTKEKK